MDPHPSGSEAGLMVLPVEMVWMLMVASGKVRVREEVRLKSSCSRTIM